MKTHLPAIGASLFLCTGFAFAQTNDSAAATTTVSAGSRVLQSPGVVTDRVKNPVATSSSANSSAVGILVKDGKTFLLRGGQLTAVNEPLSLTVSPDGSITGFDGMTVNLPDNQMLTMDGRLTAIPAPVTQAIVPGLPPQKITDTQAAANEEMSKANSAGTTSTFDVQPTTQATPGMMESSGSGSSNQPRKATTGSSEKTSLGPK